MTEFRSVRERDKTWEMEFVQHTIDGDLYKVTNAYPGDYILIKDDKIQLLRKVHDKFKEIRPLHEDESPPRKLWTDEIDLPRGYKAVSDMFGDMWFIKSPEGKEIGYVDSREAVNVVASQIEQGISPQVNVTHRRRLGYS